MDVRAGGGWRFVIRNPDGSETGFRGTYREVTPPERIVQTFEWEGMPGHVSVETAVFEDLGDRTRVTTTSLFHTAEERDGMLASGMEGGLNETSERLDEVLARLASRWGALRLTVPIGHACRCQLAASASVATAWPRTPSTSSWTPAGGRSPSAARAR
jgi:Activator of Hsp90 ATPase homolog 1-like protein